MRTAAGRPDSPLANADGSTSSQTSWAFIAYDALGRMFFPATSTTTGSVEDQSASERMARLRRGLAAGENRFPQQLRFERRIRKHFAIGARSITYDARRGAGAARPDEERNDQHLFAHRQPRHLDVGAGRQHGDGSQLRRRHGPAPVRDGRRRVPVGRRFRQLHRRRKLTISATGQVIKRSIWQEFDADLISSGPDRRRSRRPRRCPRRPTRPARSGTFLSGTPAILNPDGSFTYQISENTTEYNRAGRVTGGSGRSASLSNDGFGNWNGSGQITAPWAAPAIRAIEIAVAGGTQIVRSSFAARRR